MQTAQKRILIVEDEKIVARDLALTLEELGYAVSGTAESSKEAIGNATLAPPDLVLMDLGLKGDVDGIEAARALKRLHDLPIVYLTGRDDETTLERAIGSGPDGYLLKPVSRRSLRSAIELAFKKHSSFAALAARNHEVEAQSRDLGLLMEMGELLQICDTTDEALATLLRFGPSLFPSLSGTLFLGDRGSLSPTIAWGPQLPTRAF